MTKHYTDEGTLLIRNSDIKDGKFEFGDNPIYLEKTFAEKNETRMHQIGDVITVHTGDVGTSAVITENEAKSIGFATIVTRPNPKIIDSNYLCSFLNTDKHKKWAVSISTGDGRTNYNLGDYFELVVPVPSIAEQKKIASYIQKLNRLITLHQREFAFLCKEKSKKFRYIKNAWEQRKLGGMASLITKGTTPLDKSNTGVVNFVKIESIDESSGNITITQKISLDEHNGYLHRSQLKENDILFSIAGTLGRVTSVKSSILPANTNQALAVIRLKDGCLDYVKTYLKGKAVADFIKKNPTIGAQPNLSLEQVANLEIIIPSEDEQKIIGAFFQQLDNLITLHQRKPNFYTGGYYAE